MIRLCLVAVLLLSAAPARADDVEVARERFTKGKAELDAGRAAEALADFDAAYAARPAPSLFFYMAAAQEKAGHPKQAAELYKRYLAGLPQGPLRAEATARIAALQPKAPRKMALGEEIDLKAPRVRAHGKRKKQSEAKAAAPLELPSSEPLPAPPPAQEAAALPLPVPAPPAAESAPAVAAAEPAPAAAAPAADATWTVRPDQPTPTRAPVPLHPEAPAPTPAAPPPAPARTDKLSLDRRPADAIYVAYTARLLVPGGSTTFTYATTSGPSTGTLFTNGFAVGREGENFRNAVYFGFGTEGGGPGETLRRYELSWQLLWSAFGTRELFSPYLGFRLGGMLVESQQLTAGSPKPGLAVAGLGGVQLQTRYVVVSAGLGYDENIGPKLSQPGASISGYSFDLGATLRF